MNSFRRRSVLFWEQSAESKTHNPHPIPHTQPDRTLRVISTASTPFGEGIVSTDVWTLVRDTELLREGAGSWSAPPAPSWLGYAWEGRWRATGTSIMGT